MFLLGIHINYKIYVIYLSININSLIGAVSPSSHIHVFVIYPHTSQTYIISTSEIEANKCTNEKMNDI